MQANSLMQFYVFISKLCNLVNNFSHLYGNYINSSSYIVFNFFKKIMFSLFNFNFCIKWVGVNLKISHII